MKKIKFLSFLIIIALVFEACTNGADNPSPSGSGNPDSTNVIITADDFSGNIDEIPENGDVIGTVSATASDGSNLTYSLSNQSVTGALAIDTNTGELSVANNLAFDFEVNPIITASYTASNGTTEATANINIDINDLPDPVVDNSFVITWQTTSDNEIITIPTRSGEYTYSYSVNWGDGTGENNLTGDATHTYALAGTYLVRISGDFPAINFGNSTSENRAKIQSIDQWGNIVWQTMASAFSGCENLNLGTSDSPNFSQVESTSEMFANATSLNSDVSTWDVGNIKNMEGMFEGASSFNQNLSGWAVFNVTSCSNFATGSAITLGNMPDFTNCSP